MKKEICMIDNCNRKQIGNPARNGMGAMNCLKHLREFNRLVKEQLAWGKENQDEFLKANEIGTKKGFDSGYKEFKENKDTL